MRKQLLTVLRISAVALLMVVATDTNASVQINEIMQSNVYCVFVEHEFPDSWVELYNSQNVDVSLDGWSIGLSEDRSEAWQLSEAVVPARGYLLIYCDKGATGLHTDFRLDSGSGSVYLFDADGVIVDNLKHKKQAAPNIAYGRTKDGGDSWGYFINATPGESNTGTSFADKSNLAPEPIFSREGFVGQQGKDAFTLLVKVPADAPSDARLCVTIDGREPTIDDQVLSFTKTYSKYVNESVVVRAKIITRSTLTVPSVTHSYILLPEPTNLPVFSLAGNPDYFYSDDEGIFVGDASNVAEANYVNNWRRPINLEYFVGTDHELLINQLCETRVQGNKSRNALQKSLAVYSNKRFGVKRFSGKLWHEKDTVTEVKSFLLRNGGNNFGLGRINDQVGQSIMGRYSKSLDWQAYEPAIYFLNGKYMGITDLRERSDEDNVLANHGIEDIDFIDNWYTVEEGTYDNFKELVNYWSSDTVTYEGLKKRVDIDNLLDFFVIRSFSMDTDFPNNNIAMWRPREEGGRWRFMLKDLDRFGEEFMASEICSDLCTYIDNYIEEVKAKGSIFFPRCLNIFPLIYRDLPELKQMYIDRMTVYLGDFLRTANGQALIDEYVSALKPEYLRHLQVYFDDNSTDGNAEHRYNRWEHYVSYLRDTWWQNRLSNMYKVLNRRYNLGITPSVKIHRNGVPVNFNDIELCLDDFDGCWFADRVMHLSTTFGHMWLMKTVDLSNKTTVSTIRSKDLVYLPTMKTKSIEIDVVDDPDAIAAVDDVETTKMSVSRCDGDVTVSAEAGLQSVTVYTFDGRLITQRTKLNGINTYTINTHLQPSTRMIVVVGTDTGTKTYKL